MKRALPLLLIVAMVWNGCLPAALGAGDVRSDTAVAAGLAYLARQQGEDGAFSRDDHRLPDTAAAVLAFLSGGYVPDVGRYGLTVRRAVEVLLSAPQRGAIDELGVSARAIITLAMIEASTVEPDPHQRRRLSAAIAVSVAALVAAQRPTGGWTDRNGSSDDPSATRWAALALSAARAIGLAGADEALARAASLGRPTSQPAPTAAQDGYFLLLDPATPPEIRLRTTQRLLDRQSPDGSWAAGNPADSTITATAISLLMLTSNLHFLKSIPR
jgi:hypothetical protein